MKNTDQVLDSSPLLQELQEKMNSPSDLEINESLSIVFNRMCKSHLQPMYQYMIKNSIKYIAAELITRGYKLQDELISTLNLNENMDLEWYHVAYSLEYLGKYSSRARDIESYLKLKKLALALVSKGFLLDDQDELRIILGISEEEMQ